MTDKTPGTPEAVSSDTLWAVIAVLGRSSGIAEVHASQFAAVASRRWREQQVRNYADLLRSSGAPLPIYSVTRIRRSELPRGWRPLPALGFLRDRFD